MYISICCTTSNHATNLQRWFHCLTYKVIKFTNNPKKQLKKIDPFCSKLSFEILMVCHKIVLKEVIFLATIFLCSDHEAPIQFSEMQFDRSFLCAT